MSETATDSFSYGDWVRCNGSIRLVYDSSGCSYPGKLGLLKEDAPIIYDKKMSIQYPEIIYYPVEEVEKLPEVDVDDAVMRSFFRLETTPWRLCEQGKFPFSDRSGMFTLTEEDLKIFAENLPKTDSIVLVDWKEQFASRRHVTHVCCPHEETDELSLNLVWVAIREIMTWFDIEDDEPETITDIIDAYFASKGKNLSEIDVPDSLMAGVITAIEENAEDSEPTEDEKKAYVCFLDKMCSKGDAWALEKKADAYYGGNRIVPCDWKITEQALLGHMEYLYNCDYTADDFDPDGRKDHLNRAIEVMKKYTDADFYTASFDWMKQNCKTSEQYTNFAHLFFYYGGINLRVADYYPFLSYLYNGIDWDGDKIHADEAENVFYSIVMGLIHGAGIYHGYADEYEPFEDDRLKAERAKIK